jgi:putative nucleotidyltransferase with HDIG domain
MQEFLNLRPVARAYVAVVVLLGAAIVAHSVRVLYAAPIGPQWFVLAGLTLLTGSFTVKVPSINASLSVSETFVFLSVLIFGPAAGAVTVLLECLIILFWMKSGARVAHRVLFNIAAPAIAIWVSGSAFYYVSQIQPYSIANTRLENLFGPLVIFTALYFLLNSWLVAFALGFETRKPPFAIWWKNFTWLSVNYFSGASVAALIVTTYKLPDGADRAFDFSTLAIIVPLLVVSYLTFRTAMGRLEDASLHLTELNQLYLSTIETLAMAIDAKDQVTHGHIRRVQIYATGLAREIGVKDERLIKAIEAAALLHDMGKLAVPEYILNKPGKLTPAEFEKMKLHASVGADILSAINFPYPVVPIVRHHHENWDGTGYPAGLRGTDIPIGARILSVVDCFDALTSDRPYRPRLPDVQALEILNQRRGSMYDPLVVDTFVQVHDAIAPESTTVGPLPQVLDEIASARKSIPIAVAPVVLDDIAASADETLTMFELARDLSGESSAGEIIETTANSIKRLIPHSLCVFYVVDENTAELDARHAIGAGAKLILGLRVSLGQRLSGWVATNRQTIVNSDPVLDFGDAARYHTLGLKSCLSTALTVNEELLGVLSLYSTERTAFTEDHRRIIETVASQVSRSLRNVAVQDQRTGTMQGLPRLERLAEILKENPQFISERGLLLIAIDPQRSPTTATARRIDYVGELVQAIRTTLRETDLLFFDGTDKFVVLLKPTTGQTTSLAAHSLRRALKEAPVRGIASASSLEDLGVDIIPLPVDDSVIRLLSEVRTKGTPSQRDTAEGPRIH